MPDGNEGGTLDLPHGLDPDEYNFEGWRPNPRPPYCYGPYSYGNDEYNFEGWRPNPPNLRSQSVGCAELAPFSLPPRFGCPSFGGAVPS